MKPVQLVILFFISFISFLLLTGCNNASSIVLTNNDSIGNLNKTVKDRFVRVKTLTDVYEGENLIIRSDSAFIRSFPYIPRAIPNSNIREIHYLSGSDTDGVIELNNKELLNAYNIRTSTYDTVTTFGEILPAPFGFPTKNIIVIQLKNRVGSALTGMGIGLGGGLVAGTILGLELGLNETTVSNSGLHRGEDAGIYTVLGSCSGGLFGALVGGVVGAGIGGWVDINVAVKLENEP
jgi:hypothetical protein